jgi:hypothetical protein
VDTATRWKNEALNNAAQFLKMQQFRAALSADLRKVVAQRNPNMLTLDEMYQIAMDTQRESGPKVKKTIAVIHLDERDDNDEDEEIAAFQKQKTSKSMDRKKNSNPTRTNYKGFSTGYKSGSGPGNNSNGNRKNCFYCKLQNHMQKDCFNLIRDKKLCKDKQGCAYWPWVYITSNSDQQEISRDSSRVFTKEPNDSPHPGSRVICN